MTAVLEQVALLSSHCNLQNEKPIKGATVVTS